MVEGYLYKPTVDIATAIKEPVEIPNGCCSGGIHINKCRIPFAASSFQQGKPHRISQRIKKPHL